MECRAERLTTTDLRHLRAALAGLEEEVDDAERAEQIRALEELKAAAAAAQAKVTAAFVASQRAAQAAVGVPDRDVGRGIAAQLWLAKRESPFRAARYVGWAGVLVAELPATFASLQGGKITEWRAQIVARETGWLTLADRRQVDTTLAPRLQTLGDRQVEAETKRLAYRLDPHGYLARIRGAEADRRVSLRPAPDTMALLSGLLPVAQGVAVHTSLRVHADTLRAGGDTRTRGQIMADTLVERITGQDTATAVPVEANLVMTDSTLFNTTTSKTPATAAGRDEPALVQSYGPIPAELARRLVRAGSDQPAARVWLRRLYTDPTSGRLLTMDSTRRHFPPGLRKLLVLRDQSCRTPWCDAPIRHTDHVTAYATGGPTGADNGQGLCEACNHTKQAPGWTTRPGPQGAGTSVTITTPTGHSYLSRPPDPPGHQPPRCRTPTHPPPAAVTTVRAASVAEDRFRRLLAAA